MRYPFLSISASLFFWLIIFICCDLAFFRKSPTFLNIDADNLQFITPQSQKIQASNDKDKTQLKSLKKINSDPKPERPENVQKTNTASAKTNINGAKPIYTPLPQIPEELRDEAFSTFAIAHFDIAKDGSATVRIIKPCENPRLNYLLLENLKNWKFAPTTNEQGEPIASVQDIKVGFNVE